jgi:PadR family transcriptional regulator PadR
MSHERELLKGNTPTLVLAVLRDGPLHGYAIAREIERRSGNALTFKEGTLYPALHALERQGLISGEWNREEGARERKVYAVTPGGLAALNDRVRGWSQFVSAINDVLSGERHGGTERSTPQPPFGGRSPSLAEPEPAG